MYDHTQSRLSIFFLPVVNSPVTVEFDRMSQLNSPIFGKQACILGLYDVSDRVFKLVSLLFAPQSYIMIKITFDREIIQMMSAKKGG